MAQALALHLLRIRRPRFPNGWSTFWRAVMFWDCVQIGLNVVGAINGHPLYLAGATIFAFFYLAIHRPLLLRYRWLEECGVPLPPPSAGLWAALAATDLLTSTVWVWIGM